MSTPQTCMQVWPKEYRPLALRGDQARQPIAPTEEGGLPIASVPLVENFAAYTYLWPSPLDDPQAPQPDDELPLDQPYLVGAQVMYHQTWNLMGHARGELLHSLPLAPGEETTIDVLTWDRNVYRRDEELLVDLEREVAENQSYKDSREVTREIQKTKNWYASGKGSVNIFNMVKVNADPGGISQETVSLNKNSHQTIAEATQSASTRLHNQRKTSISTTREFGREERVSRRLVNTNRCHSVSYHFYEVLRSYRVATALASPAARPCIFVKQSPPIERSGLLVEPYDYHGFLEALRWLHFNSHLIARGLLDRSFYAGLAVLPRLVAYWSLRRGMAASASFDAQLRPYVHQVVSGTRQVHTASEQDGSINGRQLYILQQVIAIHAPWIFETILTNADSLDAMQANQEEGALTQAVDLFLTRFARDYPLTPQAFRDLLESNFARRYIFDPVTTLKVEYSRLIYGPAPGEEPDEEQLARMTQVSEAIRLMRHVEQNHLHYFQLVWAARDPGQIMVEAGSQVLPGGDNLRLAEVIEPTLLGFYADYAVFPYTAATADSLVAQLVEAFNAQEDQPPKEADVVLPTNGIVVEAQLGSGNACEPFIQEHRRHDLALKGQEVVRAEVENQRRRKKVKIGQLDNPECCPSPRAGIWECIKKWFRR